MKRLILLLLFLLLITGGYHENVAKAAIREGVSDDIVQTYDVKRYKLFPTQNMWIFIKLDTQTGRVWQLQYSVEGNEKRFESDLNPYPIMIKGKKVNGRFELYPTQNIYNFILLDQIDGRTWQVQWALDEENRGIFPINAINEY